MRNSAVALLLTGMMIAVSCTGRKVYDTFKHTPVAGWEKNDTLSFRTSPVSTGGLYDTELALRINGSYPFTSLTLIIEQTVCPAHLTHIDTLNCRLIDDDGMPTGQGVSYYQYSYPMTTLSLQTGDSLIVNVRHDMKREILPGISDIGFSMSRH